MKEDQAFSASLAAYISIWLYITSTLTTYVEAIYKYTIL